MFDDVCNVQITNCTVSFGIGVSIRLIFSGSCGKKKYLVICSKHFHYRAVSNAGGPSLDRSAATPRSLAKQVPDGRHYTPKIL